MINSVNSVGEVGLSTHNNNNNNNNNNNSNNNNSKQLPYKMVPMESFYTGQMPPNYATGAYDKCNYKPGTDGTKEVLLPQHAMGRGAMTVRGERVTVQRIEMDMKPQQNSGWIYNDVNNCYKTSAKYTLTKQKNNINNNNNNNINNKYNNNSNNNNNNNNNNNITIRNESAFIECDDGSMKRVTPANIGNSWTLEAPIQRTEDQEDAYRHIENVHYAKLKRHSYSNGSSNGSSSMHDDEEDDDDDDDDDDEEDEDDEEEAEEEADEEDDMLVDDDDEDESALDLNADYVRNFKRRQQQQQQQQQKFNGFIKAKSGAAHLLASSAVVASKAAADAEDMHVDVETITQEQQQQQPLAGMTTRAIGAAAGGGGGGVVGASSNVIATPDHHARRPMNAFLIFCKRHRGIVKERYKSLENRAITKILGEWWASLDAVDKQCFTDLAQQNKDAFFSANPNFKWYKLPAPPLRTLNTRPGNIKQEMDDDFSNIGKSVCIPAGNYFKLADEAQMGEQLSALIHAKRKDVQQNPRQQPQQQQQQTSLQQALGETTQFLSTHMPIEQAERISGGATAGGTGGGKRLHQSQSFSGSNSSEEDALPKKSDRRCKGRIYQELISSGQITAIAKKIRVPKMLNQQQNSHNQYQQQQQQQALQLPQQRHYAQHNGFGSVYNAATSGRYRSISMCMPNTTSHSDGVVSAAARIATARRNVSESDGHYDFAHFDLELKIRELPGLSLDAYLQRKRCTKKKKKFHTKKRNSNSMSSNRSCSSVATLHSPPTTPPKELPELPAAVGSQKRKARKESITRRDVSAIESEVASLMTLGGADYTTISGCYYYDELQAVAANNSKKQNTNASVSDAANVAQRAACCGALDNVSTSDLLILAEVAANRTELTN